MSLRARYEAVRGRTEGLCAPLEIEDYVVSSMPDVSPTKWHLAHTTWFFETFVLTPHAAGYASPNPAYSFLFNSYYVQAGERHCRAQRGLVTRPTVRDVFTYRAHVDDAMQRLLDSVGDAPTHPAAPVVELGIQHEQQHQELMLTDIKHVLWTNPLRPAYSATPPDAADAVAGKPRWHMVPEGLRCIGHTGPGFAFDNESPMHRVFIEAFQLSSALVTNGEYLQFVEDGGYRRADLWLSRGLAEVRERHWEAPLYWERTADGWAEFTLAGLRPLDPAAPVNHVSYYEADAYARWAEARLPTEFEWEAAAGLDVPIADLFGRRWQWTQSAYTAYPNYRPATGALGEYNGKWMADQWVLRGSSSVTPPGHARHTYRNFFPSDARWQYSGIRLARGA